MAERIKPGDVFVCYLTRLSRWFGLLEVIEGPFIDDKPIFAIDEHRLRTRRRDGPHRRDECADLRDHFIARAYALALHGEDQGISPDIEDDRDNSGHALASGDDSGSGADDADESGDDSSDDDDSSFDSGDDNSSSDF